jgi:high affinity Mn2+ porin
MMCGAQMVGPTPQPQGIPVTPEQAEQVEEETWAIHGQATNAWLLQPAFPSPFRGPHSLRPGANGRETVDVTLYAGFRRWPGAEIWINPEVDQGFGLSNTFGVAGYVSGEAYKVGKAEPYFLVQRGFLRQTINLGGEQEKLDPGLNQLASAQTADRLVLTVGKYSVVDIFDNNAYAHDPRSDFFNWSIIAMSAFTTWRIPGAILTVPRWNGIRICGPPGQGCLTCRKSRTRSRSPATSLKGSSWPNWKRGTGCGITPASSNSSTG